jgi:hypothetical protein
VQHQEIPLSPSRCEGSSRVLIERSRPKALFDHLFTAAPVGRAAQRGACAALADVAQLGSIRSRRRPGGPPWAGRRRGVPQVLYTRYCPANSGGAALSSAHSVLACEFLRTLCVRRLYSIIYSRRPPQRGASAAAVPPWSTSHGITCVINEAQVGGVLSAPGRRPP